MQPRVLDRDREAGGDRREQLELAGTRLRAPRRIDGEQTDHLVAHHERQRGRALDSRFRERVGHVPEAGLLRRVADHDDAARAIRPQRELEQRLRGAEVRAGEPTRRAGREPALVEQVDREPLGADELPELLGRSLERVLERELLVRLSDDGEKRARLRELCLDSPGPPARSERVCGARREVAELLDEVGARDQLGREHELEQAEGRFAELLRDRPARAELQDPDRRRRAGPGRPPPPQRRARGFRQDGAATVRLARRRRARGPGAGRASSCGLCRRRRRARPRRREAATPACRPPAPPRRTRARRGRPVPQRAARRCGRSRRNRPRSGAARHSRTPRHPRRRARRARSPPPGARPDVPTGSGASPSSTSPDGRSSSGIRPPSSSTATAADGPATARTTSSRWSSSTMRATTTSAPVRPAAAPTTARRTSPRRPPRAAARPASASASSAPGSSPARSLRSGCTAIRPRPVCLRRRRDPPRGSTTRPKGGRFAAAAHELQPGLTPPL